MNFIPTDAPPGSAEKLEVMRQRFLLGLPFFHPCDRNDLAGFKGAVPMTTRDSRKSRGAYGCRTISMGGSLRKVLSE